MAHGQWLAEAVCGPIQCGAGGLLSREVVYVSDCSVPTLVASKHCYYTDNCGLG